MNQETEDHIRKNIPWTRLPSHIKQILNNAKNYERIIVTFSIQNQLRYRGNLVRHVLKNEKHYYERIIAFSREKLMLFPYHLSDMIVKGLRITPFNYYISVLEKLIQNEKSYDTLPNFTAADCLRLLGIGRNEYIELINRSRSNRGRLFSKRNIKELLPKVPVNIYMEPWWRVEIGLILEEDIKMVNEHELKVIDQLIDLGSHKAGDLDYHIVMSLYKKGLIYLDVPVAAMDKVRVPPLQGFVMNRILGDYFETLLYKIFVSIDERTTLGELSAVLEVDINLVKQAVSLYCRLQFAEIINADQKTQNLTWLQQQCINDEKKNPRQMDMDITPLTLTNKYSFSDSSIDSPTAAAEGGASEIKMNDGLRIAFLFDSALTAFLMMGNLSPGLKKHAVTMFEVGKLSHESLDSFLMELDQVRAIDSDGEGEARRFFDHAVILRSTILALRKLEGAGLDLIRLESLNSLDEAACQRLLKRKYKLLILMAPIGRDVRISPLTNMPPVLLGPSHPEVNSLWFRMFLYFLTGYGPPSLLLPKGKELDKLPRMFIGFSRLLITSWLHEPAVIPVGNILYVNATLQFSPVLIQGFGVNQNAEMKMLPFPFHSNSHKNKEDLEHVMFLNHPAVNALRNSIDLEHNCGYISLCNTGVLDLGRPLGESPQIRLKDSPRKSTPGAAITVKKELKLQSPVESHFAVTPVDRSSPTNGFLSHDCSTILQEELDRLDLKEDKNKKSQTFFQTLDLLSPVEENVGIFSRIMINDDENVVVEENDDEFIVVDESIKYWTILDCHFGVPLFEADANTKICDAIISGGLTSEKSLNKLMESNEKLGKLILDFISQCQYFSGENMEILKRGKLVPTPKRALSFDNGRITEWNGK